MAPTINTVVRQQAAQQLSAGEDMMGIVGR
jgi:hypothetical protein